MTVSDIVKIIDNKIKQNKPQFDLDRQAAKNFDLLSGKLVNILLSNNTVLKNLLIFSLLQIKKI